MRPVRSPRPLASSLVALGGVVGSAILGAAPVVARAQTPEQELARARGEYEIGEYKKAVDALYPLLYPQARLTRAEDLREAHRLLGSAYFYLGDRSAARREFVATLNLDPDFELDPVLTTAELYAFFESVKTEIQADLELLRQRRERERQKELQAARVITIERDHYPTGWYWNFIPFGTPQFYQDRTGWGTFFALTQGSLAFASASLFTYQALRWGVPLEVPQRERDLALSLQVFQVGTGAFFFVAYGWQILDALNHPRGRIVERRSERLLTGPSGPSGLGLAPAGSPFDLPVARPVVTPFLGPGVAGLGAAWEF